MSLNECIDQERIFAEIPPNGDISTRELFYIFYPNLKYKTGMKEYVMLNMKIIRLRKKLRIQITRNVNNILHYQRR